MVELNQITVQQQTLQLKANKAKPGANGGTGLLNLLEIFLLIIIKIDVKYN